MPWEVVLLVACVIAVGATVQSMIGIGLGIVGAPILALVEPSLVPALLLVLSIPIAVVTAAVEWRHVDWRTIVWILPSRIPGIAAGAWLVSRFDERQLGVAVAVMVLVAVVLAVRTVQVSEGPVVLTSAGFFAGLAGTATAIGGPAIAIALSGRPPRQARATVSFFFAVGSVASLVGLGLVDAVPASTWPLAGLLLPVVAVSLWCGIRIRDRVPREAFRRLVLALCSVSALILLVRSVG